MGLLKNTARKVAMSLAQNKNMQAITQTIMAKSTLDENGKLWSPSGKCIGWYNRETGIGWCNLKGYKELCSTPAINTEDVDSYDEVDLSEYFEEDFIEE